MEGQVSEAVKIDENWLAEQIAAHWGEAGAHVDIYRVVLGKARWAEQVADACAPLLAWAVYYGGLPEDSDIGGRAKAALKADPFPLSHSRGGSTT